MNSHKPKIVLINPCYSQSDTLGPFARYISSQLPLSIGFLAGYLRSRYVDVTVIDEQLHPVQEQTLVSCVENHGIRIIGITVLTLTSGRAYELGAFIKHRWPHVTVVMGGVHVTLLPGEPLEQNVADIVVRNEGGITLGEIVERISCGETVVDVVGISFRHDGRSPIILSGRLSMTWTPFRHFLMIFSKRTSNGISSAISSPPAAARTNVSFAPNGPSVAVAIVCNPHSGPSGRSNCLLNAMDSASFSSTTIISWLTGRMFVSCVI